MAGTHPAFNATEFVAGIKLAMGMGQPQNPAEVLRWHWRPDKEQGPGTDLSGNPYDWTAPLTPGTPGNPGDPDDEGVVVDYALEYGTVGSAEAPMGQIDTTKATVTLLDVDYEKVKTADHCTVDGSWYDIDFSLPPQGLFNVTVYTVQLSARDV